MFKTSMTAFLPVAAVLAISPAEAAGPADLCAGKETVDATTPIPPSLVPAAIGLFGGDDEAFIRKSTVYRCMNGQVWLCNYGANLVCDKANIGRRNPGVAQWCKEHPGSPDVPMAASGHDTIYSWTCAGTKARIAGVASKVDERGYLADNWKLLR
ncbi:MAG: hypothetical protein ACHQAY_14415 [Hyphomicrobiales bacterium]